MLGGEWIGIGIVLLIGVVMLVVYSIGLKYTYASGRGDAPGQNYVGQSQPMRSVSAVYDAPERERRPRERQVGE